MQRAMKLISSRPAEDLSVTELAEKLGVGERHLRRLFQEHLGASPQSVMLSKRLHLARQLLSQTHFPITEIAFAAGFQSVRRFNDAFKKNYQSTPSSYRKTSQQTPGSCELEIPVLQPFDWQGHLDFFSRHCIPGVEQVSKKSYRRTFSVDGCRGILK